MFLIALILVVLSASFASVESADGSNGTTTEGAIPPALGIDLDELIRQSENGTSGHVIVLQGETALLPCQAYSLGQRTVSWIRRRDWHILSSGSHLYTADERFHVLHHPPSPDWILRLKWPQLHDSGIYECQISGSSGQFSHFVELIVWQPVASIAEGSEHHVEAGSSIQLHCILHPETSNYSSITGIQVHSNATDAPSSSVPVQWFHNGRHLEDGGKSGSKSSVLIGSSEGNETRWTVWTSRLQIAHADIADSGNYTCSPRRGKPATVSVFVTQGDWPAAVQRQGTLVSSAPLEFLIAGLNLLLIYPYLISRSEEGQ